MGMGTQVKKWIIRNLDGHIYGPFEVEKIQELLNRGIFSGDEQVAEYPVGDWMPMSADPQLYDLVLEQLASPGKKKKKPPKASKKKPDLQKSQPKEQTPEEEQNFTKTYDLNAEKKPEQDPEIQLEATKLIPEEKQDPTKIIHKSKSSSRPLDIELVDRNRLKNQKRKQQSLIPVMLLLLAGVVFYLAFNMDGLQSVPRDVSLLRPRISQTSDPSQTKGFIQKGLSHFYQDTFLNYVKAQDNFVRAVESNPSDIDSLSLLAMTYLELWPYSKQDSRDQGTVQFIKELTARADPYGVRKKLVNTVVDYTLGRSANIIAQIDAGIAQQPTEGRFYVLKAKYLFENGDYNRSASYFQRANRLMQNWINPILGVGLSYSRMGNGSQAKQFLEAVLQRNSEHVGARSELGIVEGLYFNNPSLGKQYLTVALDEKDRLAPRAEARARYYLALFHYNLGEREQALTQVRLAVKSDPLNPDARELIARLGSGGEVKNILGDDRQNMAAGEQYMRMKNYLAAQARFKAAFRANPKNSRAAFKAAQALWKLNQAKEAIVFLKKAIAADPKFVDSYVELAKYLTAQYDFEGAVKILEAGAQVSRRNYMIYRGYAQSYLKKNDLASAEKAATKALRLYEPDVESNQIMAQIKLGQKDVVKAIQYARRAKEIDASNPQAHVTFAKIKYVYEGVEEASEYLRNQIENAPTELEFRLGLAEILISDEQFSSANQVLQSVVLADQQNKRAFLLNGDAYFQGNDYPMALKNYLSAARIDPSDPTGIVKSGDVYMKAGRFSDAQKQYDLAIRINPRTPLVHLKLAKAYFRLGMGDLAIKELKGEIKINPGMAEPYETLGDVYVVGRKFRLATRQYQKATELDSGNAKLYIKLAKAYRGMGSLDVALSMLRLAASKESGNAEIFKEKGLIYESKGQAQLAIGNFRQYLELSVNARDRNVIQQKIDELE